MSEHLDRQIISALQVNPRVSWSKLGEVLAADPTTLSRRWAKLVEDRIVWSTAFEVPPRSAPNPRRVGLIEVRCTPGRREEILARLREQPLIYDVHCTSGDRDLAVLVPGPSLLAIDAYVDREIASVPGITSTRTHYLHRLFRDGPSWRLPALDPAQRRAVELTLPPAQRVVPTALHRELIEVLNPDLRLPTARIHERVGRSLSTVSRSMESLFASDWFSWRVDLAHDSLGWEAEAWMWLHATGTDLPGLTATITALPQSRLAASVGGAANLVVSLWLEELHELDTIEHQLRSAFPDLQVVDRWLAPRVVKRQGHVLDPEGKHQEHVPIGRMSRTSNAS